MICIQCSAQTIYTNDPEIKKDWPKYFISNYLFSFQKYHPYVGHWMFYQIYDALDVYNRENKCYLDTARSVLSEYCILYKPTFEYIDTSKVFLKSDMGRVYNGEKVLLYVQGANYYTIIVCDNNYQSPQWKIVLDNKNCITKSDIQK